MLGSQGVALATAIVISGTVIFLAFSKHQVPRPPTKALRSCLLSSDGKKRKKQRVRFADNVKEPSGNGEDYRRQYYERMLPELDGSSCWTQIPSAGVRVVLTNREAPYCGISRDRVYSTGLIDHSLLIR